MGWPQPLETITFVSVPCNIARLCPPVRTLPLTYQQQQLAISSSYSCHLCSTTKDNLCKTMHADRPGKPCSLEPSSYNMYALCACIKFITRSFTELCATVNSYDLKKREGGGTSLFYYFWINETLRKNMSYFQEERTVTYSTQVFISTYPTNNYV